MSSATIEPKRSFFCCPSTFGSCCGSQKGRKPNPGANSTIKPEPLDSEEKKDSTDGNLPPNNPFLIPENEPEKPGEPNKILEPLKPSYQPRKVGTPVASPAKVGFLVSFLVDARGGAMKGNRGSGLRLIIPPGAVDSPVRVTCRYVRRADKLLYPPPLMEREALVSRILEMGPNGAEFSTPVLIEVPHFASLRDGERELVVLRSDDGETWKEHTLAYLDSRWEGGDDEIYQDFVATTNLPAAYEELETDRVVRISAKKFPRYFAILSRIREEVRALGSEGGKISTPHAPHLEVFFPKGALQKKIKVGLQIQKVPDTLLSFVWPDEDIRVSPLVALEPRRRRFHCPVQVMLYLPKNSQSKVNATLKSVRLLCSLTGGTSKANWEDVTEDTPFCVKNNCVIFETRVSALFWAVAVDRKDDEKHTLVNGHSNDDDYEPFEVGKVVETKKKGVLEMSTYLYDELVLAPYMAKIVVLYKPHMPHAWCDCLRVLCVTDDKAESAWSENKIGTSSDWDWKMVAISDEMEVSSGNQLNIQLEKEGNIEIAGDCQIEFAYRQSLVFEPFKENASNLLIRAKNKRLPKLGRITIKKCFKHVHPSKQLPLCSLDLDLGGGLSPGPADLLSPSPGPTSTTYSLPDLEVFNGSDHQVEYVSTVAHRVILYTDSLCDQSLCQDKNVEGAKLIQVKECETTNGNRVKNSKADELGLEYTVPKNPVWF